MTIRNLPEGKALPRPQNYQWDLMSDVLAEWSKQPPLAQDSGEATVINIFDQIGFDSWDGTGTTAKRISAALRAIGNKDVTVRLNSPGGDMFEGIAIYNLLRNHKARVTIEVVGWAASAASVIAMAGDDIRMGVGTFMMVHNAWGLVVGNQHDMREAADIFAGFDGALADIYEARTGMKRDDIVSLMDKETFLSAREAVAKGFADAVDEDLKAEEDAKNSIDRGLMARRQTEAALAKAGFSRDRRSALFAEMGVPTAAPRDASRSAARDAGIDVAALQRLIETLKN